MLYNIYHNITDSDFEIIQKKIELIKSKMNLLLKKSFLKDSNNPKNKDALIVDFIGTSKEGFFYNLGFSFDDLPNSLTFTFGVTKSIDINNIRHFRREDLAKEVTLDYIANRMPILINEALSLSKEWQLNDLNIKALIG